MARLGIDKDFLREFAKLERHVQDAVYATFSKFDSATHAGIHLEKINARDTRLRSIRIDKFWRGIVLAPDSGDLYTLLTVRPHDDAYAWAQRRQVTVNRATGAIEIRDVEAIEAQTQSLANDAPAGHERLFAQVNDADLVRLGIDDQVMAFARVLTDVAQLEAAREWLPAPQYDALLGLASGLTPEEVWAELAPQLVGRPAEQVDVEDVTAAVERSTDRVVVVTGAEELEEALTYPFEQWRVFLHPSQRRAAYGDFGGPARVMGGPGTGKTVVAVHRAKHLAERAGEDWSVLLTTFTRTLARSLEDALELLIFDEAVLRRVDVRHIDRVAYKIVSAELGRLAFVDQPEQRRRWREIIHSLKLEFSDSFLAHEWRDVILAQQVTSLEEYLMSARAGRGRPLGARQRERVWEAVELFDRGLAADNLWTHETVAVRAAQMLEEPGRSRPYEHVVVDEAQDLNPMQWRLLRNLVARGPNDLFIAGDPHQRIYDNRVSLRSVGVDVAGRSTRLRVNYRTTAEILQWSMGIIGSEPIDDMVDGLDTLHGLRSELHGAPPVLYGAGSREEELDRLAEAVRTWLSEGVEPAQIGVAARSRWVADSAAQALRSSGIRVSQLTDETRAADAVAVGTMHRMKGLEFRCVAVIGISDGQVPSPAALTPKDDDPVAHRHDLQRERCLLFVACTRAREQLLVTWHGTPSDLLPRVPQG